jgi:spoIIIJ-associated protein
MPTEPQAERPELSGEPSVRAAAGRELLVEMLRLSGFDLRPVLVQDGPDEIHFDLRGNDTARVIGNKGDALLALQFLVNRMLARKLEGDEHLVLDAANYRNRRREALAQLARTLAQRAIDEKKVVRLSPMSAHDRRIFHITLQDHGGVSTRSEGEGLFRPLLIIPAEQE